MKMQAIATFFFTSVAGIRAAPAGEPILRVGTDPDSRRITFLSWDTEGGDRAERNLLRAGSAVSLRARIGGEWRDADPNMIEWTIAPQADRLALKLAGKGQDIEIVVPFDPRVTPATVIPSEWADDGSLRLPAAIVAPDFGAMRIEEGGGRRLRGRLEGSRKAKTVDLIIEVPALREGEPCGLALAAIHLAPPAGLRDEGLWRAARRGWLGAFQPSARWGDAGNPFSAPAGMLANNVISDPASCSLWFYADQALWTPEIAPGIRVASLVRRTIDWWLGERMLPSGEIVGYWDKRGFLDANAGPLIAAWDYVEATGDADWLAKRMEKIEAAAEYLAGRDIDGDGLLEAIQSGNRNSLKQPGRSCAWWDAINCGHKDAYTNALIYRAWRCLADLERRLDRTQKHDRYARLADRLKAAYAPALSNPKTGWLAWWRSADGELHDYAAPTVNGIAIEYGLVDPARGREILDRLWKKMEEVGFKRLDLGVPSALVPVPRSDYLQPDAIGLAKGEDGLDTFGQYMNGGITAGQVLHFIAAHYVAGVPERGDGLLRAMLERQARGEFQNGHRDAYPQGIDWTDWKGNPCGYEGYLADSFRFLQAVLLREPAFRARLYGPLGEER